MNEYNSVIRQKWTPNDLALVLYAVREKGMKHKNAGIIADRTAAAVASITSNFHMFETKRMPEDHHYFYLMGRADHLYGLVKRNMAPDMRAAWDAKIDRLTARLPGPISKVTPEKDKAVEQPSTPDLAQLQTKISRTEVSLQKVYYEVVEWMFLHDMNYDSAREWRRQFMTFLRERCGLPTATNEAYTPPHAATPETPSQEERPAIEEEERTFSGIGTTHSLATPSNLLARDPFAYRSFTGASEGQQVPQQTRRV